MDIKICGITTWEQAREAVDAGATAIGFNLVRISPRFLPAHQARAIVQKLPNTVMSVGVFCNEGQETVEDVATACKFTAVQLHGDESDDYCATLRRLCRVIKAVRPRCADDVERAVGLVADIILLDSYSPAMAGGTGQTFNWEWSAPLRAQNRPFWISGGLTVDNVASAIQQSSPHGVDVASGVERSPGVKDPDLVRQFVQAARGANHDVSGD